MIAARGCVNQIWRVVRLRSLICLAILGLGCGVETKDPLTDAFTEKLDAALIGNWRNTFKELETVIFVGKHLTEGNPPALMEFVCVLRDREKQTVSRDKTYFYITPSSIGKSTYLNLLGAEGNIDLALPRSYALWAKDDKRKCTIVRYTHHGNSIDFWFANDAELTKLIKVGRIKGKEIQEQKKPVSGSSMNIFRLDFEPKAVDGDSLVQYLRQDGGEKLFGGDPYTFTKVP